jgi:shikimate kinase
MPGGGKSTVGREVARRLGRPFVDCDKEVEREAGCTIVALFARHGEPGFRDLEAKVLSALVDGDLPAVIATGGGAVLRQENRALLRDRTHCVYLQASPDFLWHRLRRDRRRPLLQVADPQEQLRAMSRAREPLYVETAHDVVEIEKLTFERVVETVLLRFVGPTA